MFDENNFNINNEPEEQYEPIEIFNYNPEKYLQKRDVRQKANLIGMAVLCAMAISYFWNDIYLFFTIRVLGFSEVSAQKLMYFEAAVQQINQIVFSLVIFLLPFTIAAKLSGEKLNNIISFGKPKAKTFGPFVLFGIGFCAFSNIVVSVISTYINNVTEQEYNVPSNDDPKGIFGFILSFIATAIVPAIVEEFACRGVLIGLLKKHGEAFAIISSAVVFGVIHGNFEQIPFAFVVGLILGYVYVKTESLWSCILVHCVNNASAVVFTYVQTAFGSKIQAISYTMYLIVAMLVAIFGVVSLSKYKSEDFSLNNGKSVLKEGQKFLCFFTSWTILSSIAVNIYEAIGYFQV